jgi:hypothetical protein
MGWTDCLKEYPLEWLLDPSNPSVRYWTLQKLMDKQKNDIEVQTAQKNLMESSNVQAILEAQHKTGYWINPENMYLPKYRATTHCLLVLAEFGAKRTPSIEKGIEHIFKFQRNSGHFLSNIPKTAKGYASKITDGCCLDANILFYLNHFNYVDDPRTIKLIDFLIDQHSQKNAGWKCRAYPIDPSRVFAQNCFMGAAKVLKAFAAIPIEYRSKKMNDIIRLEVENILKNQVYRYLKTPEGNRKDKAGWKRFGFPLFYQSDILEVLDTLTNFGVSDKRMRPALDIVLDSQQKDGTWLLKHTFNSKMWIDVEKKHEPSKWITLRALRVIKKWHSLVS